MRGWCSLKSIISLIKYNNNNEMSRETAAWCVTVAVCDAVAGCAVVECAVVVRLKNKEFTGCLNLCEGDYSQKENRQRIVISSACCGIYFRNRNRIVRSRFRLFFVTVLIPVSARTHPSSAELPIEIRLWMPAIRACQKFLHPIFQIVRAESFAVLWVWINIAVIQIFKCVHGFHPFPNQTPYHSLCRKSSTFQNKKAATVSDSRCVS